MMVDGSNNNDANETEQLLSSRLLLWAVISAYLLLGIWFSVTVPAFETPDEIYHYAFGRHIAQGNGLPVQDAESTGPWEQEGSQAPLYYLIAGALTAGVDQSDFDSIAVYNPRANIGDPLYPGNKNRMLYSAAARPLTGANLALHIGRWLSLLLGAVTLWLLYRTANYAFPSNPALPIVSVALVAFMPQYLFISASYSNDILVTAASAAVLFWLAKLLTDSQTRIPRFWEWLTLGVLLGIAALTKLQALGLFALAGGVGLWVAWQQKKWQELLKAAIGCAFPALVIAGWWYWRNITLYGDWTGLSYLTSINGMRTSPLEWEDFWHEFRGLRYSFWGLFGWFNILLPTWFYSVMDVVTGVAVVGPIGAAVRALIRRRAKWLHQPVAQVRILLLMWILLSAALLGYWMMRATGSQGRLIFPALTALSIWFVIGWDLWLRRIKTSWRHLVWSVLPMMLLGMSIYAAAIRIPAAYAAPRTVLELPAQATVTNVAYGTESPLHLQGVSTPDQRYRPGDSVPVTLYLSADKTADKALERNYELFVQLLDVHGEVLGNVTSHPGWGSHPTSLWEPDVIYADEYSVRIDQLIDAASPMLAHLYVGFVDPDTEAGDYRPLSAYDQEGNSLEPIFADITVLPLSPPELAEYDLQPLDVEFADGINLLGVSMPAQAEPGAELEIALHWKATGAPTHDYTSFVHIVDQEERTVAGYDIPPAQGRFPTRYWETGDDIISTIPIQLPDDPSLRQIGPLNVMVGLYQSDSEGAERLAVTNAGERTSRDERVHIGAIEILEQ